MRFYIFILLSFFIPSALFGQENCNYSVTGEIIDAGDGSPLIGANIRITGENRGTISDLEGKFLLEGLCAKNYELEVSYVGYLEQTVTIKIPGYGHLKVEMKEDAMLLETIVIEEENPPDPIKSTTTLDQRQLEQTRGKSLGESLKSITGVTSLQTGPTISKPIIHGLHSNRILILNNGIRQEGQQWGSEHAPEIDPFIASDITVVKGAEAVRYGSDAIAGMIIVEPPKLHRNTRLGGEMNIGFMSNSKGYFASGLVEGSIKGVDGFSWRIQGTGKKAGDSHTPDYILSNTGLNELDFSLAAGYHEDNAGAELYFSRFSTELGILSASHIGNLTDLEEALNSDEPLIIEPFTYSIIPPRQEINHNLIKFSAYTDSDKGMLTLQYGGQLNDRKEFDIRRVSTDDRPSISLQLFSHTIDLSWESKTKNNFQTVVGINGTLQENNNQPGTGVRPLIPDFDTWSTGIFGIERYIQSKWLLEGGVRYDYSYLKVLTFDDGELVKPEYNFHNLAATLGFEYEFSQSFKYTTNISTAFRPPHVSELFSQGLHHGTASIEEGLYIDNGVLDPAYKDSNPNSETALKWIHSFIFNKNSWEFEISPYWSKINNFIFLEPQQELRLTIRGSFPVFLYKQTNANFTGVDGALNYHFTDELYGRFKGSIVRGRDISQNDWLIFLPADRYEFSLHYEKEQIGGLNDFHLSLGGLKVMEQIRVPSQVDYKIPPPSYFLMNFHTGFGFLVGSERFEFYLNIDNILNTKFRDYLNRFRYYADDAGRNFTIRLKYDFHQHNR